MHIVMLHRIYRPFDQRLAMQHLVYMLQSHIVQYESTYTHSIPVHDYHHALK
jgi:hypothetical protein